MPDYSNGKIYTIRCRTDDTLVYVGSTINPLYKRFYDHKKKSKYEVNCISLYKWVENWDDWYIELYENFPCSSREELCKREGQVIREIGNINQRIAGRDPKQYYQETRDYQIERKGKWRERNPDKIKDYYEANKEKNIERVKLWNNENQEHRKQYKKEWINRNLETIKNKKHSYYTEHKKTFTKIECECGGHYLSPAKSRHFKTKKHQDFQKQQKQQPEI